MLDLLPILKSRGIIEEDDVAKIAEESRESGSGLEVILKEHGIGDSQILEAKGELWSLPTREVGDKSIPYDVLKYVPEESAKHYRVVPLALQEGALEVGIVDPDNIDALDALNFISTKESIPFKIFLISQADYERIVQMYQGVSGTVSRALSELETKEEVESTTSIQLGDEKMQREDLDDLDATIEAASKKGGNKDYKEQAPITKIVSTILRSSIETRASDIHIEPTFSQVRVRFRVDGILNESLILPGKVKRSVVARIKILAGIKLDERRKPQDGRFSATIAGRRIDFRVSTFPTYYGEKVVLRVLDSERSNITLKDLGMNDDQFAVVDEAIKAPYGIILITGPTGSGKSTTLYAMLNEVDRNGKNALSLEDPVEYNIEGVSQSQVKPEIGYTFASGIRSVLRQDPDIIMVGEIRDKETAKLAVQAALTGHLVFSTLHTNSAIGAVPRLVDMGVDPFLLAPSLQLIVAQRLVRKICPDSGKEVPIEGPLKNMVDDMYADIPKKYHHRIPKVESVLGVKPSSTCPTGTRGRLGVYEMLRATDEIRQAILTAQSETTIMQMARANGMMTLKEDAIIKAMEHLIPFEEVASVGGFMDMDDEEPEEDISDGDEDMDKSEKKDVAAHTPDLV